MSVKAKIVIAAATAVDIQGSISFVCELGEGKHRSITSREIEKGGEVEDIPLKVTSPYTVTLCARSAQLRPLTTTRSQFVTCASLSAILAARNRATFSTGVSVCFTAWFPDGGGPLDAVLAMGLAKRRAGFEGGVLEDVEARGMGVGLL